MPRAAHANVMHLSMLSRRGGGGRAWGGDLTFLKNLPSNSLPTGKSFQSNATKFPHPGLHIAVKYPKAGPNKGTIEISPNKTNSTIFIYERCCITKDTCSCHSSSYTFKTFNPCYTAQNRETLRRKSTFCKFKHTVLSKGHKESYFCSLPFGLVWTSLRVTLTSPV